MPVDVNASDSLLTEVERQQKYLAKLPKDYQFPLFNASQALESQRRSGYRNSASAAREIVDNAIEAKARRIDICFERPKQLKAHQRSESIHAMAFIDNGSGMLPDMARYALSWGSGTHFDEPGFIGKFGFGLPNASINQTRLVEVYTKTADAKVVTKATLDVRQVAAHALHTIGEPCEAILPEFVQSYLDRNGLPFEHGTVVVWLEPDRLSYKTPALMKEHLLDDFGVTYRYLLEDVEIYVDKTKVAAVDPLFLTPHARYYLPKDKGGAEESTGFTVPVKYARDPETGFLTLSVVTDPSEIDLADDNLEACGVISIRVARFPYGFAEAPVKGQKATTDSHKRFEIRKTRRGMSFVRAGREIETVDVFPKSIKDQAKGLGNWPLLQSYAYHWGVEVRFNPDLDEVFGITNDKQTVRPVEDLWRVLATVKLDQQLGREQAYQRKIRKEEQARLRRLKAESGNEPSPAEAAAADADAAMGQRPVVPERHKAEVREKFEKEAATRSRVDASSVEDAKRAIEEEAKRRPYLVDFFDEPRGPFFKPEWRNSRQVAMLINREHAFFEVLYGPLMNSDAGDQAKEAVDVLLLALARSELSMEHEETAAWYVTQRERKWSEFLADAYRSLKDKFEPVDEEAAEDEASDERDEDMEVAE